MNYSIELVKVNKKLKANDSEGEISKKIITEILEIKKIPKNERFSLQIKPEITKF